VFSCGTVFFSTSSLGALTREWLAEFPGVQRNNARILFPSETTIAVANAAGFGGEEMICLQSRHARAPRFPRDLLCEYRHSNVAREPVLSHAKFIAWISPAHELLALYVGSHNLTATAWG
jgi:hypothetical protein